jgi:hypothetical protein
MPTFTFYLEDGPAMTPEFVIEQLPDRKAAFGFARDLLEQRPRYSRVEITQGAIEIGRLQRDGTQAGA